MTREQFITHIESTQGAFRRFLVALCCGDTALADDIAQESYVKAYLSCDGFKDPAKFNAWIYRIGYTTSLPSIGVQSIDMDCQMASWMLIAVTCIIITISAYDLTLSRLSLNSSHK